MGLYKCALEMSTYRKQVNLMRRKHVRLAAVCHSNAEVEMRIVGYRTSSWGGGVHSGAESRLDSLGLKVILTGSP